MQLTKNFKSEEAVVSKQFPLLVREIHLTQLDTYKVYLLFRTVLQPTRNEMKCRILVSSGKRSPALNDAIGGEIYSEHLFYGWNGALDVTIDEKDDLFEMHEILEKRFSNSIGRAILYLRRDFSAKHIHVSLPTERYHRVFLVSIPKIGGK